MMPEVWLRAAFVAGVCVAMNLPSCYGQSPRVSVYWIGATPVDALSGEAVGKKEGWKKITDGQKTSIKGAIVLENGRLAVVLRPKSAGVDVYGISAGGVKLRADVAPVADGSVLVLDSATVESAESDAVFIDAVYKSSMGESFRVSYSLGAANPILTTKPGAGVVAQKISAPSRLGVMPDFFADDIVIDANTIPSGRAEVPGDNFFMNMMDGGNSIVTTIWDRNAKDPELSFSGQAGTRVIRDITVWYGPTGTIWVAAMEGPGLWGQAEIDSNNVKSVTTLPWKMPFMAKWKGDFTRVDRTVDSWEFDYNPPRRNKWSGSAGDFEWPCWIIDKNGECKAMIQPALKFANANFAGAFVVYPIDRAQAGEKFDGGGGMGYGNYAVSRAGDTPLDQLTIADLMRNSMGIGPCQYVMDVAGQGQKDKGIFTCAVRAMLPAIYADKRQKEERVFIERMLNEMIVFVKAIEDRVNSYVDFRGRMLAFLSEQKKLHPDQSVFIGRMEDQARQIQSNKLNGSKRIDELVVKLRAETLSDEPRLNIKEVCGIIADGVAEGQDNASAKCRQAVKILRQKATMEMAVDPKVGEVAREIRKMTQDMLRGAVGHEAR